MNLETHLLDTGPLVALLVKNDDKHERAVSIFSKIEGDLITCEPVLTEACFLVRKAGLQVQEDLLGLAIQDFYRVNFILSDHWQEVSHLLKKYRDQPISLADACLIRMAEVYNQPRIVTFDSDFATYRWGGRKKFDIVK